LTNLTNLIVSRLGFARQPITLISRGRRGVYEQANRVPGGIQD